MNQQVDVASLSATREELSDEVSISTEDEIPSESLFKSYGTWARMKSIELFSLIRSYEKPYRNYYIVICPYGRKKGIKMDQIIKIVKRWGCNRVIITRETMGKKGQSINPHYNIVITTKKKLKDSNSNNLNIKVQKLPNLGDITRAIDYCFKEYIKPLRSCKEGRQYYVWKKNNLRQDYECPENIEEIIEDTIENQKE